MRSSGRRTPLPGTKNELLIVASSLRDVDSTLHRLLLVAALVPLGVLGGIALLGTGAESERMTCSSRTCCSWARLDEGRPLAGAGEAP